MQCKDIYAYSNPLYIVEFVSNRGGIRRMQFALEERGKSKMHSLSPLMHLRACAGRRGRGGERGEARGRRPRRRSGTGREGGMQRGLRRASSTRAVGATTAHGCPGGAGRVLGRRAAPAACGAGAWDERPGRVSSQAERPGEASCFDGMRGERPGGASAQDEASCPGGMWDRRVERAPRRCERASGRDKLLRRYAGPVCGVSV